MLNGKFFHALCVPMAGVQNRAKHTRLKIHGYMCEAAQTGREGIRVNGAVQDGGGFIEEYARTP
jgi:hypothetical protein